MSQVQKLESLLSLVQRNRQQPRTAGPVAVAAGAVDPELRRSPTPSPLEVAIGGAQPAVPKPAAAKPRAAKPRAVKPVSAKPMAPRAPAIAAAPRPAPRVAAAPMAAKPIAAASVGVPTAPVVSSAESSVVVEPKTFGELLTRSLALRPR